MMIKLKGLLIMATSLLTLSCFGPSKTDYWKTVEYVDIERFMGKWYVIASRPTGFEDGAHNAIEIYTWNKKKKHIDVAFDFNKDSFDGKIKSIPQKAFIYNHETNAHWKVNPFLWFKFDYLVIGLAEDYSWTAIGTPDQKYVWIMAREWMMSDEKLKKIKDQLASTGYSMKDVSRVPQSH